MQVDDLLRQRKADAGFSAFAHVKAVEDVRQVRFGNAVPVVLYPVTSDTARPAYSGE